MFKLAEESLKKNPNLQKVIILKSLPRYDSPSIDFHSIKTKPNQLANTFYDTLWMQKGCPSNILIVDQNLDCQGPLRKKRFGIPGQVGRDGKPWDGVHMRGTVAAQHYTNSLVRILVDISPQFTKQAAADYHNFCPQAIYQSRVRINQNSYQTSRMAANHNTGKKQMHQSRRSPYTYSDAVRSSQFEKKMFPNEFSEYHVPTKNRFSGLEDNYQGNY